MVRDKELLKKVQWRGRRFVKNKYRTDILISVTKMLINRPWTGTPGGGEQERKCHICWKGGRVVFNIKDMPSELTRTINSDKLRHIS